MKFTSEDLMKSLGLKIGSRFKHNDKIFEVYLSSENEIRCYNINNSNNHFYLRKLIDADIEILPPVNYVGELICRNFSCKKCDLKILCNTGMDNKCSCDDTLYKILEESEIKDCDEEIYNLLKARLDKEVIEER